MPSPLVSIAIPAYNSEATLPAAIQSIFAQTYTNWELIIIDDGSSDRTSEIVTMIADARVKVLRDGQNRGLPYRLNQATEASSGEFLFRMDADDLMHPERIEKQVRFLQSNPEIDLVGTAVATINKHNQITGIRGEESLRRTPKEIFKRGLFIHPTVAGRRSWFLKNPYNNAYRRGQDFELWCRTGNTLRAGLIREPLLFYRDGYSSASAYAVNAANARRVIWQLGPEQIGLLLSLRLIAERWTKQVIHSIASKLRFRHHLIRRRTRPLSAEQLRQLELALTVIRMTHVPGLAQSDRK